MPKMRMPKTFYVNGGDEVRYHAGRVYNIEPASVDRWLIRGAVIVPDTTKDDEVVEAQLDASLAAELEKTGTGTHEETTEAIKNAAEVAGEEFEEEEFEDADESDDQASTTKKKSSKKKNR